MGSKTRMIKVQYPAASFEIDEVIARFFKKPGFRVLLTLDHRGYLTEEPKFLNDDGTSGEIECELNCPEKFTDYRLRLRTREDDPDVEDDADRPPDPVGCVLIRGKWRC